MRRRCPVCGQTASITAAEYIFTRHRDGIGAPCPMAGHRDEPNWISTNTVKEVTHQ